ncbi:2-(1,2-epoxy-1,2-dihydrophenyl)acetyl-CoA isomerase PaaG [Zobellella aerophila]|uniref:2-(1,2-epoxy-1,2-dihydrophenyl)acetyl-CoA isomerase PaaG n=1 Tax=Zobellella aerophila TaxID=870480 RepID=A0ABP6VC40_9GAMM
MEYQHIECHREGAVGVLVLNRPAQLNSFNEAMHQEVAAVLKDWENNPEVRTILLTGNGRGFCAGQDLGDRAVNSGDEAPDLGRSIDHYYNPLIKRITGMPKPVICAVNGVAAGAGANIALACDIVIAARSASFIQAFCRLGLVPDSGGTWLLPRLIGRARALALTLRGDKVSAEQAREMGMIWQVVEDDRLQSEAMQQAQQLSRQPTYGLGLIKRAINSAADNSLNEQLELERDLQRLAGRSEDYREGVDAFLNKRTPEYRGR